MIIAQKKCPQEELACEIAKGRMYATNEVVRLQKELKEIKAKAIDEFVKKICEKYTKEESKGNYKHYCVNIKQDIAEIAEQMKGE